jgi:hypothetical protein
MSKLQLFHIVINCNSKSFTFLNSDPSNYKVLNYAINASKVPNNNQNNMKVFVNNKEGNLLTFADALIKN